MKVPLIFCGSFLFLLCAVYFTPHEAIFATYIFTPKDVIWIGCYIISLFLSLISIPLAP